MKLTLKQKKFADEYLISGNATDAAIKAGYSKKYAHTNASKLLQNTAIKNYIAERRKEIESHKIMDAKEAMQLLTSIARGEVKETVIVSTKDAVWREQKEADLKTRISAIKEILKRYPDKNDEEIAAQIRKLKADADIAEWKAGELAGTNKVNDKTVLVDDIGGNDNGNNGN
ncbi:MAG: terminase small subunit [Liquorilactobacillus nagelii]|jgi:phage terminase small subunit|uniref:terminase small subunit n=1 Tax=Liquorilactobacillus nagelii TaxID=82688 RepID=UPI002431EB89|nr:terminase small subunit [Liquorilactobacillus nagelii]MCI1921961.1 terminase small subunit [Liquorilactobacillus nagelii]MCI1976391.1 terminase small subunit [Liquorilactobacillus nagelii]